MAKSGKVGRPRQLSDEEIQIIYKAFEEYINSKDIPEVKQFAILYEDIIPGYKLYREQLYNYQEFDTLIKKCADKKSIGLELGGLSNQLNNAMAIFLLKQLGYSDKMETVNTNITVSFVKDFDGV